MTFNLDMDDWKEITKNEYRRLKTNDPNRVNGYTARIGFKYYRKTSIIEKIERIIINYRNIATWKRITENKYLIDMFCDDIIREIKEKLSKEEYNKNFCGDGK